MSLFSFAEKYLAVPDIGKSEARGAAFGMMLYRLDAKHREQSRENVAMVFPNLSKSEQENMVKEMFRHFGRIAADFVRSPLRTNDELIANLTAYGSEEFYRAHGMGEGVLAVTAHLGNWERFGHWCLAMDRGITCVGRDADDGTVQARVNALRTQNGMGMISRGNAIRQILKLLKDRQMIGILPDQNSDEAYIPFFGKPAGTVLGPAVLHLRTGAPIIPCCCVRVGVGKYEVHIESMIIAHEGETAEALMGRINQAIERMIMRAPEQYLWMHDRWRNARREGLL